MNNTKSIITSQQKDQEKSLNKKVFSTKSEKKYNYLSSLRKEKIIYSPFNDNSTEEEFIAYIHSLTDKQQASLNYVLELQNKNKHIYPTQNTIANNADCDRATVNRTMLKLEYMKVVSLWRGIDLDQLPKLLPHFYIPHKYFSNQSIRNALCNILPALKKLSVSLILSTFVAVTTQAFNLFKCDTVTKISKKEQTREKQQHLLYEPPRLGIIDTSKYEGEAFSNKMSSIESYIFFVEEREPMELTKEELLQIAQKPKEAVDYARHIVKLDLAAGKQISNLFSYVMGIIERHEQRIPKTGKSETPGQTNTQPFSVAQKETHFDAALKFETRVHDIKDTDPIQWNMMRSFTNPFFNVISPEEQQLVMGIHQECKCRLRPF
jgi:hypothetical protein